MAEVGQLLSAQWTPAKSMSRADLKDEVETWRSLFGWLDDETKYFLSHIGEACRVIERNYHGVVGTMLQPRMTLYSIEVGTVEKIFNQVDGKYYLERKAATIPASNIIKTEFIQQRTPVEGADDAVLDELMAVVGEVE